MEGSAAARRPGAPAAASSGGSESSAGPGARLATPAGSDGDGDGDDEEEEEEEEERGAYEARAARGRGRGMGRGRRGDGGGGDSGGDDDDDGSDWGVGKGLQEEEEDDDDDDDDDDEDITVAGASFEDHARYSDGRPGATREGRRQRKARGRSASTAAGFPPCTPDEERAVVRKFDRRLVVFVALLYMLSFLDRSNIGNARIAGMDDDLQSTPRRDDWYEWALSSFYVAYIAFEWMALLWRLVPAHVYVAALVLSWGVTASLQAVATGYPMLIALRALLGIGEAGFTGIPFYLSFFYRRHELAFRTAIFISAAPLATSFASSLAWLIIKLGERCPIAPWRLLFLVEGFPSVLVAVAAWSVIPDSPQTAAYLTPRERKVARLRLRHERPAPAPRRAGEEAGGGPRGAAAAAAADDRLVARDVLAVLGDPAAWLTAAMFFLTNMAYSSLPVFLPTILTEMGHDALTAQALAAPPYLASFAVVLATAHASDRLRCRGPLIAAAALASSAGYAVLALSRRPLGLAAGSPLRYLAVYPAAAGFFSVVVLTVAWSLNNQRGASRQGGGFALLQAVGQCGPLVGARLYPRGDAPFYEGGMRACAAAMAAVAALALGLRWWLARLNRRLDEEEGADGIEMGGRAGAGPGPGPEEEQGLVGGSRWGGRRVEGERFRYML